ncbi:hypothetical protein BRC92_00265 [Halobacteriales archaeon QS_4_69_31]|nr:MAG: hypothetical protein BRC92_00265 [Halobacteriales archaeon QS_4_69_31]
MGDEAETVDICPGCGETHFRSVASSSINSTDASQMGFHCWKCGARFDEPDTKAAEHTTEPRRGSAKILYDAPPDTEIEDLPDLLAEHGGGSA